jgi:hypothetical protein
VSAIVADFLAQKARAYPQADVWFAHLCAWVTHLDLLYILADLTLGRRVIGWITPIFHSIVAPLACVKVDLYRCSVKIGVLLVQFPVTEPESLQDEGQLAAKDRVAPSGSSENHAAAYVTVYGQGMPVLINDPFGKHFVT